MPKRRPHRPTTAWSVIGLFAFYTAADCFLTYRGLPSPFPVHLVEKIAEDTALNPWQQRNKTLLPGLIIVALVGALAHHVGFRCVAARPDEKPSRRMELPFGLSRLMVAADHKWLYWGFIFLFHAIPLSVTV